MSKKRPRVSLRSALRQTDTTAMYPGCGQGTGPALAYVGLGLAGEAGEVANQIKKVMRDDDGLPTPPRSAKLFDELGDVMWYWLRCCRELGFDPYDVVLHNLQKLAERQENGTLQGDTAADGSRGGVGIPDSFTEDLDSMLADDAEPVLYDDPKLAYDGLVTHEQRPAPVDPEDASWGWGPRVLHVLTCACACAVGGTAWVVSGYRELGVVQDMYAHLREAHTNPGAVVRVEV
jgi:NTP pyrophosphatase (non-canonical NTP hydrolase)